MKKIKTNIKIHPVFNKIHFIPITVFIIGVIIVIISSSIANDWFNFFTLSISIAFAAMLIGLLFGFLFGIPKLNKKFNPVENYTSNIKYKPNTNLEDISDWLTKVIIGISLTQIIRIPKYLENIANFVLNNNECKFHCDYAQSIIISDILIFIIIGFIIGYFYTRLYLPNLLSIMEEKSIIMSEKNIWKESYKKEKEKNKSNSSENNKTSKKTNISKLTDYEINILKKINKENNNYKITKILNFDEFAALNVLLEKGIIEVSQGEELRMGASLRIIDKDIENEISNLPKASDD